MAVWKPIAQRPLAFSNSTSGEKYRRPSWPSVVGHKTGNGACWWRWPCQFFVIKVLCVEQAPAIAQNQFHLLAIRQGSPLQFIQSLTRLLLGDMNI